MQTNRAKLGKGRKTQVRTKLCGMIKREALGPSGFFLDAAITSAGLFIYVQSSSKSGASTYRLDLVEVPDVRND